MSEKNFTPETKKTIPFSAEANWVPELTEHHHEPRLAENSYELVNQAVHVQQNDCETLDSTSKEKFLKVYGIGPCIILRVSAPEKEQLGVIHFDAKSNIPLLMKNLYNKLGIKNLNAECRSYI